MPRRSGKRGEREDGTLEGMMDHNLPVWGGVGRRLRLCVTPLSVGLCACVCVRVCVCVSPCVCVCNSALQCEDPIRSIGTAFADAVLLAIATRHLLGNTITQHQTWRPRLGLRPKSTMLRPQ